LQTNEEISFDHVPTAAELLGAYESSGENDPSSLSYKRVLIRPSLHIWRVLLWIFLTLTCASGLGVLSYVLWQKTLISVFVGIGVILLTLIVFAKSVLIWLVKFYQRVAPARVRERCRFEPSCSQYMILSLKKYGFFKGLRLGLDRLNRCKPPNGGYDEP
jgi:putative membrane protein insertion efficiency factor